MPINKNTQLQEHLEDRRIYAIVTPFVKTPTIVSLETGRMAAQACHVVSKLKMWFAKTWNNGKDKNAWVEILHGKPITTIILEARNQEELLHIFYLAAEKGQFCTTFHDTNQPFYKTSDEVLTAVAIGPITKEQSRGVCDYLPLF